MGGRTRIREARSQANMGLPYSLLRFRPFHDAYESGDSDVRRPIFTSNCRKKKKKNHNQEKDDNAGILNDSRQSAFLGIDGCFCCCCLCVVVVVVVGWLLLFVYLVGWLFFGCYCFVVVVVVVLGGGGGAFGIDIPFKAVACGRSIAPEERCLVF